MQVEDDEPYLMSKSKLWMRLFSLTVDAAELIFGEMTNGASNDIERATVLAYGYAVRYATNLA